MDPILEDIETIIPMLADLEEADEIKLLVSLLNKADSSLAESLRDALIKETA